MQVSKTPDCRDAIWRRQGHITSARETKLYMAYHQHREMWKFSRGKGAHRCLGRGANLSFRVNMPQNVLLGRCLVDNRGSDLRRFARKCIREKPVIYVLHRPTHTNAVTEIHDRLCAAKDHILIVPAYLDYHGSRGRTPQSQRAAMEGEIVGVG